MVRLIAGRSLIGRLLVGGASSSWENDPETSRVEGRTRGLGILCLKGLKNELGMLGTDGRLAIENALIFRDNRGRFEVVVMEGCLRDMGLDRMLTTRFGGDNALGRTRKDEDRRDH